MAALFDQAGSLIRSLFVSMFHQTWNLRYFRHLRITICVGLEPFLFAINMDVVSDIIHCRFELMKFLFS